MRVIGADQQSRRGFTLVEMLVVILIIGVLAGLLVPVIARSRKAANIKDCHNNLKQIYLALMNYSEERMKNGTEIWPAKLAYLTTEGYIEGTEIFSCPLDAAKGAAGTKPAGPSVQQFPELSEPGINLSYLYEMSGERCSWSWQNYVGPAPNPSVPGSGYATDPSHLPFMHYPKNVASWGEVKLEQLKNGDVALHTNTYKGATYPSTRFPILRCFWHVDDPGDDSDPRGITNLAYGGNVFFSPPMWETLITGEYNPPAP